jgi:transposase
MKNQVKKKPHSAEFKFKVAIEAIRGERSTAELCQEYGIVSSQIFKWKKALLEHGHDIFKNGVQVGFVRESRKNVEEEPPSVLT